MVNSIIDIPKLSEPFPNVQPTWKDSKTGIVVPKLQLENIQWREKLLRKAGEDKGLQKDLLAACKESMLFFINTFVFTHHQQEIDPITHTPIRAKQIHNPFITWEIQDRFFGRFQAAIDEGHDLGVKKSRDMGATVCCVTGFHWYWLFVEGSNFLEMSRTEAYVDERGNPKCLFWKHDYINSFLPDWMKPPACTPKKRNRTKMRMFNELNENIINGESTTAHAGSGDRRVAVLLDEFAKVEHGQAMRSATADVTPCRIVNSTPAGAGTEYSRWINSGQIEVFIMPFWEHPDKGNGRYIHRDESTNKFEIRSPWLDGEAKRRSKREMAQEILMQDIESGATFFDIENIDKHVVLYGKKPLSRWNMRLKKEIPNSAIFNKIRKRDLKAIECKRSKNGKLSVWTNLIDGRPDQSKTYVFGIDLGKGQGASPSVVSIKCKQTGEKIAEWYDNNTPPYEMARIVIALALWCGGRNPHKLPFLKWEMNGPGWDFGRLIVLEFKYSHYYRHQITGEIGKKITKKYGWHADRKRKYELLSMYNRVLAQGGYINPCIPALEEAKLFIELPGERVESANDVNDDSGAHGDRVIADALTLEEKETKKLKPGEIKAPYNSFAYRQQKFLNKKKMQASSKKSWQKPYNFVKV